MFKNLISKLKSLFSRVGGWLTLSRVKNNPIVKSAYQPGQKLKSIFGSIASFIIPHWWKLAAGAILLFIAFGIGTRIGWDTRNYSALKQESKQQADLLKQKQQYETELAAAVQKQHQISQALQDALNANKQVVTQYVTKTIVKEVASKPVYQQCIVPSTGLHVINDEANQLNALRKPDPAH